MCCSSFLFLEEKKSCPVHGRVPFPVSLIACVLMAKTLFRDQTDLLGIPTGEIAIYDPLSLICQDVCTPR